jgi:nudix-type nucleoside diphosphatase (YffH/AdpP family)
MHRARVFLFGTLRHAQLLGLVAGRDVPSMPGSLRGARCERALHGDWPVLIDDPGAVAEGIVADLDTTSLARLDYYEAVFGYTRVPATVETRDGTVEAAIWRPGHEDPGSGSAWDLDAWSEAWSAVTLEAAGDIMRRMGRQDPAEVGQIVHVIRARADAVLRTRAWQRENRLGSGLGAADAEIVARRHPYDGFFGVEEIFARFRRFDGSTHDEVKRAVYRVADAASVLPYDPVRDRVLMIEQLRFGPLAQGDPSPWLLEPVAGLIDAGEAPEETARRETAEEAGLAVGELHFVARYYPSPGGVAQALYSYVGIADLPDEAAGLGGHSEEDEDILGHLIPFDRAIDLLQCGDIVNAPAIVTLQWLAANRFRLRAAAESAAGPG